MNTFLLSRPERPQGGLVVGDVNSTLACTLASVKLTVTVVHFDAGLWSDDRTMPEETNRVMTDAVSDLLFVSETSGMHRPRREGIAQSKLAYVGNVRIDSLLKHLPAA